MRPWPITHARVDTFIAIEGFGATITTETPRFTAEILACDARSGPFPDVVGASHVVPSNGQARYRITCSPHRYYVIWITRLVPRPSQTARNNTVAAN